MKRLSPAILGVAALFAATVQHTWASDQAMLELAAYNGCFICHRVKSDPAAGKPLAPSYLEIAARYKDEEGAFDRLLDRVMHGTLYREQAWEGKTSMRFMPPNLNVSRQNAEAFVHWILRMEVDPATVERLTRDDRMTTAAMANGCTACHQVDPVEDLRVIPLAPSFREIAARYQGDATSHGRLVESVIGGTKDGSKRWPNVNMQFMPPSVAARPEDVEDLVTWILEMDAAGVVNRWAPQAATR